MINVARVDDYAARCSWMWRNKARFERSSGSRRPRVLVDVSAIIGQDAQTGIQRVVRAVWSELIKRSGNEFDALPIYANSRRGYCYAPVDFLDRPIWQGEYLPVAMGPGDRFLGLDLSAHLLPKYRRQLTAWAACGATLHVVVYDMLPLQRPEWFNSRATKHFRKWFRLLAEDVDQAVCISDYVGQSVREQLRSSSRLKIGRLYMGSDISASRPTKGVQPEVERVLQLMRRRPSILMVGTVEPRKGYEVALAAFDQLWRDRADAPDLVVIGKGGWKTASLQARIRLHSLFGRRLHWLTNVSDEGLCRSYEAARAILVTSRGEGFGLPLLEAAAHRRYVLARDLPVFREQRLANVLYFNDDEPHALGTRLMELLAKSAREVPSLVELPSWSDSVDRLLPEIGLANREFGETTQALRHAS